jgi:hypothetical protein
MGYCHQLFVHFHTSKGHLGSPRILLTGVLWGNHLQSTHGGGLQGGLFWSACSLARWVTNEDGCNSNSNVTSSIS